jgi:hypothetical protein
VVYHRNDTKNPNRSPNHQYTKTSLWLKFKPFMMRRLAATRHDIMHDIA